MAGMSNSEFLNSFQFLQLISILENTTNYIQMRHKQIQQNKIISDPIKLKYEEIMRRKVIEDNCSNWSN